MHILIVEDETKVAQALTEGLEREGCDVAVALTGEERAAAHQQPPGGEA